SIAIKVVSSRYMSEHALDRFLHEARTVAQLSHPNIVQIYNLGREHDFGYIVMEFVDGAELLSVLRDAPDHRLPVDRALDIAIRIGEALMHAHGKGIIHRDIKPSNILIDRTGMPRLMDFGIAKAQTFNTELTMPQSVLGTPAYMSPEQAIDSSSVDARSDIFSLGVVLYEMLAGRRPFEGASMTEIIARLREQQPTPLVEVNPEVSRSLQAVCLKALEKTPDRRYATIEAFVTDLRQVRDRTRPEVASRAPTLGGRVLSGLARLLGR
ncbi:MAG: serine/threonine protein kinase, partial [Phycisphaerales bacterium]|nr:serine/threonine protein kinase [Phycisphaerales bacterium]